MGIWGARRRGLHGRRPIRVGPSAGKQACPLRRAPKLRLGASLAAFARQFGGKNRLGRVRVATQERVTGDRKNLGLSEQGKRKIEWADQQMPVLESIPQQVIKER